MAPAQPEPPGFRRTLCIGMASHGEFDGVWFTIQALRMYHGEASDDVSFLVIDNDPEGPTAAALRAIGDWVPRYRYVPFGGYTGTAVRDFVFREADADVVCCVDAHVLLAPGALHALREWFDAHPDSVDLLQGPMLHDDLACEGAVSHLKPTWGTGMFGQWGRDPHLDEGVDEPFEIAMQGLGLFACNRFAWPGLNPRLRGFGGEEGYLHERFRRRGGRVLCHPRAAWAHRFPRPTGTSYPNRWEDRIRNYLIAWGELGWDLTPMEAHFVEHLGSEFDVRAVIGQQRELVEHPLAVFDAVLCLSGSCDAHAHPPPIAWRVERVEPGETLAGEHRRLAGWQRALTLASVRGFRHALLLEDGLGPATLPHIDPLDWERPWDLCLLVAQLGDAPTAPSFASAGRLAMTGLSVAVHARAFDRILGDLGTDEAGRNAFLARWPDIDTYLLDAMTSGDLEAIGEPFAEPAVDRPEQASDLRIDELAGGLAVEAQARSHELNNTASIVLMLCDGERTVAEIADEVASSFALASVPLAEVSACVDGLRRAGILVARNHHERAESR